VASNVTTRFMKIGPVVHYVLGGGGSLHGRTDALTQTEALQNHTPISLTIKQKYKLNELLIWEQIKSQNAPQRHTFCPYADEQSKPVSQLYRSTYVSVAQSPGRQLERRSGLHSWGLYLHNILTNEPAGDDP